MLNIIVCKKPFLLTFRNSFLFFSHTDDLWVYFNKKLIYDSGGTKGATNATIDVSLAYPKIAPSTLYRECDSHYGGISNGESYLLR